jgi:hypothetical protein
MKSIITHLLSPQIQINMKYSSKVYQKPNKKFDHKFDFPYYCNWLVTKTECVVILKS